MKSESKINYTAIPAKVGKIPIQVLCRHMSTIEDWYKTKAEVLKIHPLCTPIQVEEYIEWGTLSRECSGYEAGSIVSILDEVYQEALYCDCLIKIKNDTVKYWTRANVK